MKIASATRVADRHVNAAMSANEEAFWQSLADQAIKKPRRIHPKGEAWSVRNSIQGGLSTRFRVDDFDDAVGLWNLSSGDAIFLSWHELANEGWLFVELEGRGYRFKNEERLAAQYGKHKYWLAAAREVLSQPPDNQYQDDGDAEVEINFLDINVGPKGVQIGVERVVTEPEHEDGRPTADELRWDAERDR